MPNNTGAPKIIFSTVDISELPPALSTSVGAMVIGLNKGDVDKPMLITDKAKLIDLCCVNKPEVTDLGIYAALGFLDQGRQLYIMRVHNSALYGGIEFKKATSPYSATPLGAGETAPTAHTFGADGLFLVAAQNPGAWSDDISVSISDVDSSDYTFKIKVYVDDSDGVAQLQETWEVSRKQQIDGYGNQQYLETKINGYSKYIKVVNYSGEGDAVLPNAVSTPIYMDGGSNGSTVTTQNVVDGWDKFSNTFDKSVNILMTGGYTATAVLAKVNSIAAARQDAFAVLDLPLDVTATSVDSQVTWANNNLNLNSSYAAVYSPWIKIFDEYNGQQLTVPPSGHVGSVYALTDRVYNSAHGAPAGYNRGILNCLGLSNIETYNESEMDVLCEGKINPIIKDPGFGFIVFDELTTQKKNSALKNIHVRRLINQIQKASVSTARKYLMEPLIERTYFRVRTEFEEYLGQLEGLGAFDNNNDRGWKVVCDSRNNTATDRDMDTLNIWIFIKPVKIARYIQIKAVITRSSANFDAVIAAGV